MNPDLMTAWNELRKTAISSSRLPAGTLQVGESELLQLGALIRLGYLEQ